jgi:hypothetical protein
MAKNVKAKNTETKRAGKAVVGVRPNARANIAASFDAKANDGKDRVAGGASHLPHVDADARKAIKHVAKALAALPGVESNIAEQIAAAKAAADKL